MRSWSIPIGRILGVELRLHLTFLFLLLFVWLTESAAHNFAPGRAFALVGIIFGCVLLHEAGHALVSIHSGSPAKAIILLPIGGISLPDESQRQKTLTQRSLGREIGIA